MWEPRSTSRDKKVYANYIETYVNEYLCVALAAARRARGRAAPLLEHNIVTVTKGIHVSVF